MYIDLQILSKEGTSLGDMTPSDITQRSQRKLLSRQRQDQEFLHHQIIRSKIQFILNKTPIADPIQKGKQ